jgi:hypothetical protein
MSPTASWGEPGETRSDGEDGFSAFPKKEFDPSVPWECLYCHFKPNLDTVSKGCQNCGRDRTGAPATIPAALERDPRLNYGREAG